MEQVIRRDNRSKRDRLCSFDHSSISGRIGAWRRSKNFCARLVGGGWLWS